MVDIIKKFLDAGFGYVLPGKIQSDRLGREFVIYLVHLVAVIAWEQSSIVEVFV